MHGTPGPALGPIRRFDVIDSTNRYLVDEARAGAPHGLVAVAKHQTEGRGRLGRRWEAPPGANLLVSVLLRPRASLTGDLVPDLHAFTVAVALAAAEACMEVAGVDPDLKWPNDLVVDDRKLAGVLAEAVAAGRIAEAVGAGSFAPAVVVGLGLNVCWPEPGSDAAADALGATSLYRLTGAPVDCDLLLQGVLEHLALRISDLFEPGGPERQAEEYRTRCATVGRLVTVEEHSESFTGRACGVSDQGHLLVDTASGRRVVTAGDVVHLRHPRSEPPAMDPGPAP